MPTAVLTDVTSAGWTKKQASAIVGGLSVPSKMPCYGWSIPAIRCRVGSVLRSLAGSVCSKCYAYKGRYVFPNVIRAMERRYQVLNRALADGAFRERFIHAFTVLLAKEKYFRWHDSGDLQSTEHLSILAEIARRLPECRFWLPTREYRMIAQYVEECGPLPSNLVARLSAHMIDGQPPSHWPTVSSVSRDVAVNGAEVCMAPSRGGYCGDCRACWDPTVPHVTYMLH
jgi:hypothetical protein